MSSVEITILHLRWSILIFMLYCRNIPNYVVEATGLKHMQIQSQLVGIDFKLLSGKKIGLHLSLMPFRQISSPIANCQL